MNDRQTLENCPRFRRDSFTSGNEAVILGAAEKRRFPVTFPANGRQRSQWDRMTMENSEPAWKARLAKYGPPEGHTEESWSSMCRVSEALYFDRSTQPRRPRCIQELRDGKSYVYFIGGEVGCIKIGLSVAPHERLTQLATGSPIPLRLLAKVEGKRSLEREYHGRFAEHRAHGEWFNRAPEILAEIERLNA